MISLTKCLVQNDKTCEKSKFLLLINCECDDLFEDDIPELEKKMRHHTVPEHDKTNKMMCTQRRLRSALASAQSDQSSLSV